MSTAGRDQASAPAASDVAAALAGTEVVRLVPAADGDSLAAAGVLARALGARAIGFQVTVARPFADASRGTDADLTVALGHAVDDADVTVAGAEPVTTTAAAVARELGETPDPVTTLAGTIAAGADAGRVAEAAERAGIERRPGVGVPVGDPVDGLAHSTLVHAPLSGETDAVADALAALDLPADPTDDDHRRVASLLALLVAGDDAAPDDATEALERALRPHVGGPLETVEGYADVLDSVARERPGVAVALALGHDAVREDAVDAWRTHARRAHAGLAEAERNRYDGLAVFAGDSFPVGTVARLAAGFRSPEPATLALSDGAAALRVDDGDAGDALRAAARAVGGEAFGTDRRAHARFDGPPAEFVDAVREAL